MNNVSDDQATPKRAKNQARRILAQKERVMLILMWPWVISSILPAAVILTGDFEWNNPDYVLPLGAFPWHVLTLVGIFAATLWTTILMWMIYGPHYPNDEIEAERWKARQSSFAIVIPTGAVILNFAPLIAWGLFG